METSTNRLARLRRKAFEFKQSNPNYTHYHNWRAWLVRRVKVKHTWRSSENPNILYCDNLDALGWRVVGDSHEVNSWIKHTGWYTDNHQDGKYVGVVLQLPSRNGVEQFVPAIRHSDWDTATVYLNEVTFDKPSAARWADQNAEREAEESREADAKDSAKQQIAEAREAIHTINKEVLPALKELKGANLTPGICSMVRAGITDLLGDRAEQFRTIKKLEDDFWQAVPQ